MRPPKVRKYLLLFSSQPKNLINHHFEMHGMNIVCILWPTAIHKFHNKRYWNQNGRCFDCAFKFINFRFESSKYLFPFFVDSVLFSLFFLYLRKDSILMEMVFSCTVFFSTRKYCIISRKVFEITCLNRINEMQCNRNLRAFETWPSFIHSFIPFHCKFSPLGFARSAFSFSLI